MFYYGLDFHDVAPNSFLHIPVFIVVCEALLRIPPTLRPMAQGLQSEAEGGPWAARGLRKCHGKQAPQRRLAQGSVCGDYQGVAAGVVLHHRTLWRQVGGHSWIQIWTPYAAHLMGH